MTPTSNKKNDYVIGDIIDEISYHATLYTDKDIGSPFIIYKGRTYPFEDNIDKIITSYVFEHYRSATKHKRDIKDILSLRCDDNKIKTYIRTAKINNTCYYKLNDDEMIETTPTEWQIKSLNDSIIFRKSDLATDQQHPTKTSDKTLYELLDNLKITKEEKILLCGALVASMIDNVNHPIVNITGDHGSGKTTVTRYLKTIMDPNGKDGLSDIKSEKDLVLELFNSKCCAFDNLSQLSQTTSDILARAATGGGVNIRVLYTTAKMMRVVFNPTIIINSINDTFRRSDILDRTIKIELERLTEFDGIDILDDDDRITNILGAIFTCLSKYLQDIESGIYKHKKSPIRLSDYYRITQSVGSYCGFTTKEIDSAFTINKSKNLEQGLMSSTIGQWILSNITIEDPFEGSVGELYDTIRDDNPGSKHPYKNKISLGIALKNITVALNENGYLVSKTRVKKEIRYKISKNTN